MFAKIDMIQIFVNHIKHYKQNQYIKKDIFSQKYIQKDIFTVIQIIPIVEFIISHKTELPLGAIFYIYNFKGI